MGRHLWALIALAALVTSALLVPPDQAYACSNGDPVADSDVIVEGWFLGWELAPEESGLAEMYLPIRVEMAVERVWKGEVSDEIIAMVDGFSLARFVGDTEYTWAGRSGACGAFDVDPTGKYGIMGLWKRDDGTYEPNLLLTFFIGDGPYGEGYEVRPEGYQEAVELLAAHPEIAALSALGAGPLAEGGSRTPLVLASAVATAGLGLLAAGAALRPKTQEAQ